jgi:hypothetical protein
MLWMFGAGALTPAMGKTSWRFDGGAADVGE